ncbi:MAG: metallophosphoesterase family protein [Solirubrobacterales bacterium]
MRLAIISDIHSNLPALEAVLDAIEGSDAEEVWCLGDVVGYGAQPDECAKLVSERCAVSLVGNHDLAVLDEIEVSAFSPSAADAVTWTKANAAPETLEFLRGLKPADESREVALYHASPRDPVWEYVLWLDQAAECIAVQSARVSLIGHSHVALFFVEPDGDHDARGAHAEAGTRLEIGEQRWLINPGSVGQPRDGDPRAAWLELDTETWSATFHRTPYEIERAAELIAGAGLPEQLGARLYVGQ